MGILFIAVLALAIGFMGGLSYMAAKFSFTLEKKAYEKLSREEFEQFKYFIKKI